MDPNEALKRLRELSEETLECDDSADLPLKAEEIAEAFKTLDEWIIKGGFLPKDWEKSASCRHSPV